MNLTCPSAPGLDKSSSSFASQELKLGHVTVLNCCNCSLICSRKDGDSGVSFFLFGGTTPSMDRLFHSIELFARFSFR